MPYRINDKPALFSLEYAKNNSAHDLELPINTDGYDVFDRDVFEALSAAVPNNYGIAINDFHIGRVPGGYRAAFTWYHHDSGYRCTTNYWGDGIYNLTGITDDDTVVRIMFDTHCMSTEDLGNKMCMEMIDCLKKEEEYSHRETGHGGVARDRRLPWKLTKKQLLAERVGFIRARKRALEHLEDLTPEDLGYRLWNGSLERANKELAENKFLLGEVEALKTK